jgi:hypothetical protein
MAYAIALLDQVFDRHGIGRRLQVDAVLVGGQADTPRGVDDGFLQLRIHPPQFPPQARPVLHPLQVTHRHPAGVA